MTRLRDSIWPEACQTQQTHHARLCWRRSKSPDAVFADPRGTTHSRRDGADRQSGISMCRGAHVRYAGLLDHHPRLPNKRTASRARRCNRSTSCSAAVRAVAPRTKNAPKHEPAPTYAAAHANGDCQARNPPPSGGLPSFAGTGPLDRARRRQTPEGPCCRGEGELPLSVSVDEVDSVVVQG